MKQHKLLTITVNYLIIQYLISLYLLIPFCGYLGVAMTKTILFISPTGTMDNGAEISIFNLMKFLVSKGFRS